MGSSCGVVVLHPQAAEKARRNGADVFSVAVSVVLEIREMHHDRSEKERWFCCSLRLAQEPEIGNDGILWLCTHSVFMLS